MLSFALSFSDTRTEIPSREVILAICFSVFSLFLFPFLSFSPSLSLSLRDIFLPEIMHNYHILTLPSCICASEVEKEDSIAFAEGESSHDCLGFGKRDRAF